MRLQEPIGTMFLESNAVFAVNNVVGALPSWNRSTAAVPTVLVEVECSCHLRESMFLMSKVEDPLESKRTFNLTHHPNGGTSAFFLLLLISTLIAVLNFQYYNSCIGVQ